ncbi:MAG: radical SAM protein [Pseudomonadota bacterium]
MRSLQRPQRKASSTYLRVSVSDRCNLGCHYCAPRQRTGGECHALTDDELLGLIAAIDETVAIRKIRITGGEPLLRPGLPELIERIHWLLPASQIGLTTNGTLLGGLASDLRRAGVESVNISLDTPDPAKLAALTGRDMLGSILQGLAAARAAGFSPIKINAVLLRTFNGPHLADLVRLAAQNGCEIRFIELMPLGAAASMFDAEYVSAGEALECLRRSFAYVGPLPDTSTARRHLLRDGTQEIAIGLIAPVSQPFCSACDRLRLDCRGRLHACLRRNSGVDVAGLLAGARGAGADRRAIRSRIEAVLASKWPVAEAWPRRSMATIGG